MTLHFDQIRAVISDMDGVLWLGTDLLPGTPAFFQFLQRRELPFALATNNSTKSVADYVKRLAQTGVTVQPSQIVTSAVVTIEMLRRHYAAGTPAYVIGSDTLRESIAEAGFPIDPEKAMLIIVGLDSGLTYEKLKIAGRRLMQGAAFIGTNADRTIPQPDGLSPGAGTMIAALQGMTGKTPVLMGKPQPAMFEILLERLGVPASHILMIGDRLDTDVQGAKRLGMQAALVLTGVATPDAEPDHGEWPPDAVFDSLAVLHEAWQQTG